MKKRLSILLSSLFVFSLISCGESVKPVSYRVHSQGYLLVNMSDGSTSNLGKISRELLYSTGNIEINSNGFYVINGIETSISTKYPLEYSTNDNEHLIVKYLDDTVADLGSIHDSLDSSVTINNKGYYVISGVETNVFAANVYTVSFETNYANEIPSQKIIEGFKAKEPNILRYGYTFDGWFHNAKKWNFETDLVYSDLLLSAEWIPNRYTVNFVTAHGEKPRSEEYKMDEKIVLPTFVGVDGYTFEGWYDETGKIVKDGAWRIASDTTLTAKWTINEYTIVLDAGVGSVSSKSVKITYGENYTLPVPTNSFGTFKGWYYGDTKITDENGNSLKPYLFPNNIVATVDWSIDISTKEQLKAISNTLNGHYKLINNIDLQGEEWTPLGNGVTPFSGIFNGNGHTISNVRISHQQSCVGLFGFNTGTISNVRIDGANYDIPAINQNSYVGGIVGLNAGTVKGVAVDGTIKVNPHSSSYTSYTGGISGYNRGSIKNAVNNATITGIDYAAGITAYSETALSNSSNSGNVTCNLYGAGIASYLANDITNCNNDGDITSKSYTAGIVAIVENGKEATISKCKNTGNINTQSDAGGIIGYHTDISTMGASYITIDQCINTGNITSSVTSQHIGGIAGFIYSTYINNSYSVGNINGADYAGGIIGYAWNGHVSNCYTVGTITTQARCGGIAGIFQNAKFKECYTNTTVSGAIVGTINGKDTDISNLPNCYYVVDKSSAYSYSLQGIKTSEHFDKDFYINSLFWSNSIWSFSENTYPTLVWES